MMARSGHNALRTGELIASWDLVEKEPGKPDFSSLDKAFELADRHGMRLLLGTGANSPPVWLLAEHPDLCIVDRDGNSYPPGAMWSWACINHPAYLREADRFLGQLLDRYGDHPRLIGWQIHNEPGYPFVSRADRDSPEWFDYNHHAVLAFRDWLKTRYEDIERLNEAWLWVPSNVRYRCFDEVEPPRRTPQEWGIPNAWMDWRRFAYDNWDAFIARQDALVKSRTPDAVTMTNVNGAAFDGDGRLGANSWTLPRQCDAIGYDLYPSMRMPAPGQEGPRNQVAWFLDFAMSTARQSGKPLWLPEMESGPLAGWAAGPAFAITSGADIRKWGLMGLSRGARMLLFQGYRQWQSLPMNWGALVDWDGKPTPRLEASSQLAQLVRDHGKLLETATVPGAKVALLHSQENAVYCASTGAQDLADRAMREMHDTLWRLGHAVEFVDPGHLDAKMGFEVLILPFQVMLSGESAKRIDEYVLQGGCLVSMPRTAMVDERCHVWRARPGGLHHVLGAKESGIALSAEMDVALAVPDGEKVVASGHHHRQSLELEKDVEVLATFADGEPAITMRKHGKGKAIHCATHLDMAARRDDGHVALWRCLLDQCGVWPVVDKGAEAELLEVRILETGDGRNLIFAANESAADIKATVTLRLVEATSAKYVWPVGDVRLLGGESGSSRLSIELPAGEGTVAILS